MKLNDIDVDGRTWVPISSVPTGSYIQTRVRDYGDHTPPPIFYVGNRGLNSQNESLTMVNLFCFHKLEWIQIANLGSFLAKVLDITGVGNSRYCIVPFLVDEPSFTAITRYNITIVN